VRYGNFAIAHKIQKKKKSIFSIKEVRKRAAIILWGNLTTKHTLITKEYNGNLSAYFDVY